VTNIQTEICTQFVGPTITAPPSGTQTDASSIIVKGMGETGMTLTITRNDANVGATIVAPDGSYALNVPLMNGDNVLVSQEVNGCNTLKESAAVTVYRTIVQQSSTPEENSSAAQTNAQSATTLRSGGPSLGNPVTSLPNTPGYQRPTITHPTQGEMFYVSHLWVTGKAQPGSIVTIYVSNVSVARTIASEDGTYGATVGLRPGANTVQVRARLGDRVATSDLIDVTYVQQTKETPTSDLVMPKFVLALVISLGLTIILAWRIHTIRSKLK